MMQTSRSVLERPGPVFWAGRQRRRQVLIAVVLAGALAACSSTPDPVDDDSPKPAPEYDQEAFEPDVPEYRELSLRDGDPEVVDGEAIDGIDSFRVGDVDVIHMPTPANEVVAARLYIDGGSATLDDSLTGIERLAMSVAANGGTESTPRDEFNARLDAVGSSVNSSTNRDFSAYAMRSVSEHFDETWELFMEAIFEPAFDEDEVERRRDRQLASIRSIVDNPDRLVSEVARDVTFEDHPYEVRQIGTEETVSQFTTDQLRAWQRHMLDPDRMLLVVVGNIDRDDLEQKVQAKLGRLEPTDEAVPELPGIAPNERALRVEQMDLPTNYILGYYAAPSFGHHDYAPLVIATRHLRNRLFEEVRTKRNLTYAVSSNVGNRGDNVGFLYVTAVDPEATIPVIMDEVERLQNEPIDATDLEEVRNVYLTGHYQDLETNASIAGQLARAELLGGDWTSSQAFLDAVMEVEPDDIQRVANEYLRNFQFGVVGDPEAVPPELFGVETDEAKTVDEVDDPELDDREEAEPPPESDDDQPGPDAPPM